MWSRVLVEVPAPVEAVVLALHYPSNESFGEFEGFERLHALDQHRLRSAAGRRSAPRAGSGYGPTLNQAEVHLVAWKDADDSARTSPMIVDAIESRL